MILRQIILVEISRNNSLGYPFIFRDNHRKAMNILSIVGIEFLRRNKGINDTCPSTFEMGPHTGRTLVRARTDKHTNLVY